MAYIKDVYFENLNIVHRMGELFTAEKGDEWIGIDDIFEQNKFYFIVEGSCTIIIDDKTYHAKRGDWFFIPANQKHTFYNDQSATFSKYFIHFDLYPDIEIFVNHSLEFKVSVPEKSSVYTLFDRYTQINQSQRLADKLELKSIMFNLLSEYINLSAAHDFSAVFKVSESLLSALTYINENLTGDLSNEILAEISHMHPNHFIRVFKEKLGLTPQRYITQKRMDVAKRLAEETTLPFVEIAELSGINDPTHFSKLFKTYFGMTPGVYRKFANDIMRARKPKF